jgi:phytoene desaturase
MLNRGLRTGKDRMRAGKIVVIGAGVGGITAAARLARAGFDVTVLEKNAGPGGRCGQMAIGGHTFDTGATLYLMPEVYTQAFAELGERIEDHLKLRRIDPTYQLHFPDGSKLELTSDLLKMNCQMEAIEPGSFDSLLRYLREAKSHYDLSMERLVSREFRTFLSFFNPSNILLFLRLRALQNHIKHVGQFFDDPRLQIAFTFQNMYMGLNPFEAPATYSFLQYTELAEGIWYPEGGMHQVVRALVRTAEAKGVQFVYRSPVERIQVSGDRTEGVLTNDGAHWPADIVVANADLPYVYRDLLPSQEPAHRFDGAEYGCSTIMFYWGLDRRYPQFGSHTLFLPHIGREGFDPIFDEGNLPRNPNFYMHIPSRSDPTMAPEGGETITIAVPVSNIHPGAPRDWSGERERVRASVVSQLESAGMYGLEAHIRVEMNGTPLDWQRRFNLVRGSTHGLSHRLTQMGYLRPGYKHPQIRNLYFVGASTHPGTGVPSVLISARNLTRRVLDDLQIRDRRDAYARLDRRRRLPAEA